MDRNKKTLICCIGDSLTEGDYGISGYTGIPNVKTENYPYFLEKEVNCTVINYGKCGFRATDYLKYYKEGQVDLKQADVILVMLGTNGGHSMTGESEADLAYIELIQCIMKDSPAARLVLITPPHATRNPAYSNCGYADQAEVAAQFIRKFAKKEHLVLFDLACYGSFCEENEVLYQANDGLHFVKEGYRELAHFVGRKLKEMFPDLFAETK